MEHDPVRQTRSAFHDQFGTDPELVVQAPGRVNLIGDHVDYAGGLVLPIAIERSTAIAITDITDTTNEAESVIHALDLNKTITTDFSQPQPPEAQGAPTSFLNYIRGPIEQLRRKGFNIGQFHMTIASSIPMGGGLSSSAALEVAVLLGIRSLAGQPTDPKTLALEAQAAEHEYAGTPCGIMDMYVSAAAQSGNACLIDCTTNELTLVQMPPEDEAIILVTDTQTRHELNTGAYAERRNSCEEAAKVLQVELLGHATTEDVSHANLPSDIHKRARHVVEEIQRVRDFSKTIQSGDLATAGQLMFESHHSLRDQFEVSCPELDHLVATAQTLTEHGVYGSRMTGGGFGGCTVTLCTPESVAAITETFETSFYDRFGKRPTFFATRPADGARVIS